MCAFFSIECGLRIPFFAGIANSPHATSCFAVAQASFRLKKTIAVIEAL
jgi:hypothetical protein